MFPKSRLEVQYYLPLYLHNLYSLYHNLLKYKYATVVYMQHDLILVFPDRRDTKCPTYFAKNYSLPTAHQPLHVNQSKMKRGNSSGGRGERPSGASVKGTQVITANAHEVLSNMCNTLGPAASLDRRSFK